MTASASTISTTGLPEDAATPARTGQKKRPTTAPPCYDHQRHQASGNDVMMSKIKLSAAIPAIRRS